MFMAGRNRASQDLAFESKQKRTSLLSFISTVIIEHLPFYLQSIPVLKPRLCASLRFCC